MENALETSTHWFWACLIHPRATYNLFLDHVQPVFAPTHWSNDDEAIQFQDIIAPYWIEGAKDFIKQKVQDRSLYLERLRAQHKNGEC